MGDKEPHPGDCTYTVARFFYGLFPSFPSSGTAMLLKKRVPS